MQRVAQWINGHELVLYIRRDDLRNLHFDGEQFERADKRKGFFFDRMVPSFQFVDDDIAADEVIGEAALLPLLARPHAPRNHVGLGSNLVVEARNGRLYVDLR